MFATRLSHGFVVLILLSSTTALAQHSHDGYGVPSEEFYKPVPPLPPDLHFTYHHASTAAEGWLRGRAALLHAQGNYMLAASQAMICHEQARSLALDNRQRWLEHRFWLKAWHEADLQRRIEARRAQLAARRLSTFGVFMLRPDEINRDGTDCLADDPDVASIPRAARAVEHAVRIADSVPRPRGRG